MSRQARAFAAMTASQIRRGLLAREFSAFEIARASLERIDDLNSSVGAFIELTPDAAIEAAKRVDARVARGEADALGPLAGVPVAFKDNLHMCGTRTSCASRMLDGYESPFTADCVARMLEAGAVPLGKLNLDEFAFGSSTETSAFGKTRNPWDLSRVPGGSSGGSAAAVAAGLAAVALGSDAGGSIRQPGSFCGVVAVKPSYGLVSSRGVAAFVDSVDQVGPITRSVEDAALVMNVIADGSIDYTRGLLQGVAGMRVGFVPSFLEAPGLHPEVRAAVLGAIDDLRNMGAQLVEIDLPHADDAMSAYYVIGPRAAFANLAHFDAERFGHCRAQEGATRQNATGQGVIEQGAVGQGAAQRNAAQPDFGSEAKRRILLGAYLLHSEEGERYYRAALKARDLVKLDYARAFERVDAIVAPVTPSAAFKFGEVSDPHEMHLSDMFTVSVNIAGNAAMSVPVGLGRDSGLPVGVQVIAPAMRDENMLRAAAALERVYGAAGVAPLQPCAVLKS